MIHHSSTPYKEAASQAAKVGREKMQAIIEKGQANAMAVLTQVQNQVPKDSITTAKAVTILAPIETNRYGLMLKGRDPVPVHEHALAQIADKAGFNNKFLNDLRELKTPKDDPWNQELIAHNFNQLLMHSDSRHLVRTVEEKGQDEVRGFLSDRYRRLDSRPLLDSFMGACKEIGAVPVDGYALDTRVRLRAVLPYVFEPVENEVMLFGAEWKNSDFGNGGHGVSLFNIRVMCTNMATTDEVLRQVHIGKRLDDNILYSRQTYELDTKANASALKDIVWNTLSPERVNGYLEQIRIASQDEITGKDVGRILKAKLTKSEIEKVQELFDGPDVINMPAGSSTYRLSNAISFFSQTTGISRNRQLDLQTIAGELTPLTIGKVVEV